MAHHDESIKRLKLAINIDAPSEVCYQHWKTGFTRFPQYMRRLVELQQEVKPIEITPLTISSPNNKMLPAEVINHWLFCGPKGKLYELDNRTILEIPNLFYSMASVDPDDIAIQTSLSFFPDGNNQTTRVELQISFLNSPILQLGKSTRLITDILATDDPLLTNCLEDFKKEVEKNYQQQQC